jgi:hypothetical protein
MQHSRSASNSISVRSKLPAVPRLKNIYKQDNDELSMAENKVSSFVVESADQRSNLRVTEDSNSFIAHGIQPGLNYHKQITPTTSKFKTDQRPQISPRQNTKGKIRFFF